MITKSVVLFRGKQMGEWFFYRKLEIFQFSNRTRQLFVRILALVKWANSVSKVDKCAVSMKTYMCCQQLTCSRAERVPHVLHNLSSEHTRTHRHTKTHTHTHPPPPVSSSKNQGKGKKEKQSARQTKPNALRRPKQPRPQHSQLIALTTVFTSQHGLTYLCITCLLRRSLQSLHHSTG